MKALVFLLVAANVLFFAWTQGYFGHPDNPDAGRLQKQTNAVQLQVVGRGEPPASAKDGERKAEAAAASAPTPAPKPEKAADAPPASETCLAWSGLAAVDADRLAVLLTEKFEDFKVTRQAVEREIKSWWVYIPPLISKAEAEKKVAELKKLGIEDYLVVTDSGPNRWAISLGVFSSEAGAQKRLALLKEKGVKSARHGSRNGKESSYTVEARGPAAKQQGVIDTTTAVNSTKLEAKVCK